MADPKWDKSLFTEKMRIFVVVTHYKGVKETLDCIRSLKKLNLKKNWELKTVLIDNSSETESSEVFNSELSDIKIIRNKVNTGFAQGNNQGIRYSLDGGADFLMLLNNDTYVDKKLLIYLVKSVKESPVTGIAAPKIYFAPGYEYHKERYLKNDKGRVIWYAGGSIDWLNIGGIHKGLNEVDSGQFDKAIQVNFASGCCMFIKKEVFEKIGFLDERYFLYLEDLDFCHRTAKAGYKLIYQPKAIVWHKNLGTNKDTTKTRQAYFYSRNRLFFGFKYASLRTKISLIRESIRLLVRGNYWQKKGVIDFYLGKLGKGSYKEN